MKTLLLSIIYICCFSISLFGQRDISGIYSAIDGYSGYIEIKDNQFKYYIWQGGSIVYSNDTLAICTFKWADKSFIELNNSVEDPAWEVCRSIKIAQESNPAYGSDSIKIEFIIPHTRGLKITVKACNKHTTLGRFTLDYSMKYSRGLTLPHNNILVIARDDINRISFSIKPENIFPHTIDGAFFGIVDFYMDYIDSYTLPGFQLKENVNDVLIEIPALDNTFFERYYVQGEYARVYGNKIQWRGNVFVKEE